MTQGDWLRVSQERPCPVCGKPDWCLVARDGNATICARIEDGSVKRCGEAGWLHRECGDASAPPRPIAARVPARPASQPRRNFPGLAAALAVRGIKHRNALAALLGVSRPALDRLQVGYDSRRRWWSFPERDGAGKVIGILRRHRNGKKKRMKDSRCGLVYADDWDTGMGPVLLVEGASDTAALMTLGISAIGRPSNLGGTVLLAELLRQFPEERGIVVLGENDRKDDGAWPGREGAIHTAQELARRLERTIHWALPPDHAKDVRGWLQARNAGDPTRLRKVFLDGLDLQGLLPPPTVAAERPRGLVLELDDYRDRMVAARLASLDRPAMYLDRSPTGSGKTHVDVLVLRRMLGKEDAA